jgi:lipopolysaccharide export system permease protein
MIILDRMVFKQFFPIFLMALLFFIIVLQLVDLFANSNFIRYLNQEVPLSAILKVHLLYLPKTISYSLPPALLFAVSYSLGQFYSNNELISVYGSGVSLYRFILPFLVTGLLLSTGIFWFEEKVVIDTFREKNELQRTLLNRNISFNNANVTRMSPDSLAVYHANYYNDKNVTLTGLLTVLRNENGAPKIRINAEWAQWKNGKWQLHDARIFRWKNDSITEENADTVTFDWLDLEPDNFKRTVRDVDEMTLAETKEWIESLKTSGLSFRKELTKYWERYAFSLTPFIVALISSAIGGRFKKNILLMSLLISLGISVVYYVLRMILVIMAENGYISPLSGAWSGVILFFILALFLFRLAKT